MDTVEMKNKMSEDRFQTLPNGAVYDKKLRKIVKQAEIPTEGQKSTDTKQKAEDVINVSTEEEKPKKKGRPKDKDLESASSRFHTIIAREMLAYNTTHELKKTDHDWLLERGFWYFDRCAELGVTPVPQGLVIALGFSSSEQTMLLSGNGGMPQDCKEVVLAFKQALEMVAEGSLVDSKSGQVGRIFDLKNRFGWTDAPNVTVENDKKLEVKSPEELRKALAKMPGLDLIDKPKEVVIDAEYEVIE